MIAALHAVMAFGLTTIEFDNTGSVIGPEKMRERPDRGVRMIGTAAARVARRGKGAELVLELAEPAHMMHLALRVPYTCALRSAAWMVARTISPPKLLSATMQSARNSWKATTARRPQTAGASRHERSART